MPMEFAKRKQAKMGSHGSLTKAGKVKQNTPKVPQTMTHTNKHHPLTKHKKRFLIWQKRKALKQIKPRDDFRRRDQRDRRYR